MKDKSKLHEFCIFFIHFSVQNFKMEVISKQAPQLKIFLFIFHLNYYSLCFVTEVAQCKEKCLEFRDNCNSLNSNFTFYISGNRFMGSARIFIEPFIILLVFLSYLKQMCPVQHFYSKAFFVSPAIMLSDYTFSLLGQV